MQKKVPWYKAAIYKGALRGVVSLLFILALHSILQVDMGIDKETLGILFGTQITYILISLYHMYLLSTSETPTVLSAIVSCCLLVSSLISGRILFGESLSAYQMLGLCLAVVAIILMTL